MKLVNFFGLLSVLVLCFQPSLSGRVYLDPTAMNTWNGLYCDSCEIFAPCRAEQTLTIPGSCELVFLANKDWSSKSLHIDFTGSDWLNITADGGTVTFYQTFSFSASSGKLLIYNMNITSAETSYIVKMSLVAEEVAFRDAVIQGLGVNAYTPYFSMTDSRIFAPQIAYDDYLFDFRNGQTLASLAFDRVKIEVFTYLFSSATSPNANFFNSSVQALVTRSMSFQSLRVVDSNFTVPTLSTREFFPFGPTSTLSLENSRFINNGLSNASWPSEAVPSATAMILNCDFSGFALHLSPSYSLQIEGTKMSNDFTSPTLVIKDVSDTMLRNVKFDLSGHIQNAITLTSAGAMFVTWENVNITTTFSPSKGTLKLQTPQLNLASSTTVPSLWTESSRINCNSCGLYFKEKINAIDPQNGPSLELHADEVQFTSLSLENTSITTSASTVVTCTILDEMNGCLKLENGISSRSVSIAREMLHVDISALNLNSNNSPKAGDSFYLFNSLQSQLTLVDNSGAFNLTSAVNDTTHKVYYVFSPTNCASNCSISNMASACITNRWCGSCRRGYSGDLCDMFTPFSDEVPTELSNPVLVDTPSSVGETPPAPLPASPPTNISTTPSGASSNDSNIILLVSIISLIVSLF